jgi:hypothetical protein
MRVGSALLTPVLARVYADRMPAYLESSNERNIALCGRHGFEVTSELALPNGPRIWPMWREPIKRSSFGVGRPASTRRDPCSRQKSTSSTGITRGAARSTVTTFNTASSGRARENAACASVVCQGSSLNEVTPVVVIRVHVRLICGNADPGI